MTNARRRYTKEFKLEAIQLVLSKGGNAAEIARDLGILPNLLNRGSVSTTPISTILSQVWVNQKNRMSSINCTRNWLIQKWSVIY